MQPPQLARLGQGTEPVTGPPKVQAAWSPGSHPEQGRLFLWIGNSTKPSTSSAGDLVTVLGDLCPSANGGTARRRRVRLPRPGEAETDRLATDLAAHDIDGIEFSPLEVLQLLPRLAPSRPGLPSQVSASLACWTQAARLALEFLVRQRYLPRLERHGKEWVALWRPVVSDPDDADRVATITKTLPGAALTLAGDQTARPAVDDFLTALVDAGVRAACKSSRLEESVPPEGIGAVWARALFSAHGVVDVETPGVADKLSRLMVEWAAPVSSRASFRTYVRLDPPPTPDDAEPLTAPAEGWSLRYGLQSVEDPSLLVPAETIWRPFGSTTFDSWGLANPQETLLQGLGVAARIWPRVARSLDAPTPSGAELASDEAEAFSRDIAPRLAEAGLGVLVPGIKPLLAALRAQLQAETKGEPATSDGPARFGLNQLVQFNLQLALGGQQLTEQELELLVSLKAPLVRIRGQWVSIGPGDVERARRLWHRRQELTLREALVVVGDGKVEGVEIDSIQAEGWLAALFGHQGRASAPTPAPPGLRAQLRPYQARGLAWLMTMRRAGLGALLADDMGLGKTLQVLAAELAARAEKPKLGPTLVVCPASVATNWRMEATKFTPDLRVVIHHGPERAKGRAFEAQAKRHDVVVTTYALLLRDLEHLGRVPWSNLVLDEAQNIKNPSSQQAQAARQLEAPMRTTMTGTPVENRLTELWSIYQFLNPGYLGSLYDFRRTYAMPVERYGDAHAAAKVARLVRPFLLRRLKTDPAIAGDLPEKFESTTYVPLTREQATLYEGVVRDALARIEQASGIERRGIVLSMLMRLKQVCNHPAHFLADGSRLEGRSGKLERLCEMLEEALGEGDRCLLFTQYREMGDLLQQHLSRRFGSIPFLHGGTPRTDRDRMVAEFQREGGPPIFLLSLKAGGTGLNLTAANRVFHFDRWWNPAVEDQATDRAFRIGQKRRVQVHKFVCAGTLEEKIDAALGQKRALADRIVGAGETWITELTNRELRDLLALRPDAIEEGPA